MVFCPNCGSPVEGRFCGKCGTAVTPAGETGAAAPGSGPATGAGPAQGAAAGAAYQQSYPQQAYPPPVAAPAAGMSENTASGLCYILGVITGILFLVIAPYNQNRNVRFHAFQSIFLHVAWIVLWIVNMIVAAALPWPLMFLSGILWMLVALGGLAVWIWMLVTAFQGKRVKLPVIGDLAEKQA